MRLTVTRNVLTPDSTVGMLDIDGVFQCYTLEPPINGLPYPAILDGTYPLRLLPSVRFGRLMWHVCDVPGRTAIEIHAGNYPRDTDGCTLVGLQRGSDAVWESQAALVMLMNKLGTAEEHMITYLSASG